MLKQCPFGNLQNRPEGVLSAGGRLDTAFYWAGALRKLCDGQSLVCFSFFVVLLSLGRMGVLFGGSTRKSKEGSALAYCLIMINLSVIMESNKEDFLSWLKM